MQFESFIILCAVIFIYSLPFWVFKALGFKESEYTDPPDDENADK